MEADILEKVVKRISTIINEFELIVRLPGAAALDSLTSKPLPRTVVCQGMAVLSSFTTIP